MFLPYLKMTRENMRMHRDVYQIVKADALRTIINAQNLEIRKKNLKKYHSYDKIRNVCWFPG